MVARMAATRALSQVIRPASVLGEALRHAQNQEDALRVFWMGLLRIRRNLFEVGLLRWLPCSPFPVLGVLGKL